MRLYNIIGLQEPLFSGEAGDLAGVTNSTHLSLPLLTVSDDTTAVGLDHLWQHRPRYPQDRGQVDVDIPLPAIRVGIGKQAHGVIATDIVHQDVDRSETG